MSSPTASTTIVDLRTRAMQAGAMLHSITTSLVAGTPSTLCHREVLLSFFVCILLLLLLDRVQI